MARLILTIAPAQAGEQPSTLRLDLDEDTAIDRADYLRRLMRQYRAPFVTLRDGSQTVVCEIDLRRLTAVSIEATVSVPPLQP